MNYEEIIPIITKTVKEARTSTPFNKEIINIPGKDSLNEFLFFIKPELTLNDTNIKFNEILKLIFEKIEEFNFRIKTGRVINADYLKKHEIINQHYGVIDRISSNCRKYVSEEAKAKFEEIYGISFNDANVYGGKEMLIKYDFLTPTSLSFIWQNSAFQKLSGGTYAQKYKFDGKDIYVINGFNPSQLEHFTISERSIVVMVLQSNLDWNTARNKFIGKTNPQEAESGSIRKELSLRMNELGLASIDSSKNGVHLSAGPVESLVELMRYNSDFELGNKLDVSDFVFGKKLVEIFGVEKTKNITNNPNILHKGRSISIFDLTEEMNSNECIDLLEEIKEQI